VIVDKHLIDGSLGHLIHDFDIDTVIFNGQGGNFFSRTRTGNDESVRKRPFHQEEELKDKKEKCRNKPSCGSHVEPPVF